MADDLRVDLREEFKHVPSSGSLRIEDISVAASSPRSPRLPRSPREDSTKDKEKEKDSGNGTTTGKEDSNGNGNNKDGAVEMVPLAHPDHHSKFDNAIMPERKYDSTLKSVCSFIIFSEFCERMAFYGFQGSLVLFMTRVLHYSSGSADVQASIWNGFCYITPLLGGWLADSKMGRFNAIMTFISIYMVGMILVSLSAQSFISSAALFFPALYIVALGTGGIKPNVSTFGADSTIGTLLIARPRPVISTGSTSRSTSVPSSPIPLSPICARKSASVPVSLYLLVPWLLPLLFSTLASVDTRFFLPKAVSSVDSLLSCGKRAGLVAALRV